MSGSSMLVEQFLQLEIGSGWESECELEVAVSACGSQSWLLYVHEGQVQVVDCHFDQCVRSCD